MAEDKSGKTEKPTPKRLREARKEGQFARTPDAATWVMIAAGITLLPRSVAETGRQARLLLAQLPEVAADPTAARALGLAADIPLAIARGAAPACLAAALAALLATAAQGVHPSTKALKPDFKRMNPASGLKRMFGPRAAWEGLKAVTKVAVISVVVLLVGMTLIPELVGAGIRPLPVTVERARRGINLVVWACTVAGLVLAVADYAYQKYTVTKQLKMSPRDIKDEMKQSEGDPQMKAAIRARQMAAGRNRMLAAVANADVVLVNPTHISVALSYTAGRGAPRVVAKGTGPLALRIREVAQQNRVPVVEDKPLARTLHRVCELQDEVPAELYTAVAKVLAFVMAAGKPSPTAGVRRSPVATEVPEVPTRAQLRARRAQELRAARRS